MPTAITIGRSSRSQRAISAAPASPSPTAPPSRPGSLGTTSTRLSRQRASIAAASSKQRAIGCSSQTRISFSETASDTSRCAACREIPIAAAISSWVRPAT